MQKTMALLFALALVLLIVGCTGGSGQQASQSAQGSSERQEAASMASDIDADSQDIASTHDYTVEDVGFERDGKHIYGELYLPDAEDPLPVVVISHGFGGNSSQVASYARAFAERGVAACAFDFCGGGPGSKSDGDMTEMSVLTEAADLNAVVDGLLGRASRLPLTLDMSELNGVEKYAYTGETFGGEGTILATMAAGDIMAYSGDCLVLFYADHPNPGCSYVPLARIDDPESLADAAGAGAAAVTFEAAG